MGSCVIWGRLRGDRIDVRQPALAVAVDGRAQSKEQKQR